MKFYTGEFAINKSYAGELEQKLKVFTEKNKTKKTLFLTMLSSYGVKEIEYARRLVQRSLTMDVLFD